MDEEDVAYLHNGILLSGGVCGNRSLKFADKWKELEVTILSEVTQSQKEEHGMYSLIYGF